MAKKGGKGKGKGKKAAEAAAEPDEYDGMTLEELKLAIVQQTESLKELKNQRGAAQIERDHVQQFLDITHSEWLETDASCRNLHTDLHRLQETHLNDLRVRREETKIVKAPNTHTVANVVVRLQSHSS